MKPLSVIIVGALLIVSIAPQTASGWSSGSKAAPNGWYWAYDDTESEPPFTDPLMPPMPTFHDIHNTGNKIAPYGDEPYMYTMPDSFWYYGVWYEPGDYLYLTSDGWVSFDNSSEEGFPDPPMDDPPFPVSADPNALIAPLWQDMDHTRTPPPTDSNRVYYQYDVENSILIIEWYKLEGHTTGNIYTFEVLLALGGQNKLVTEGSCGVVFSYHFIHFLYNTTSAGWDADNVHSPPAVGIEDEDGAYGIYYEGELVDDRVIRMGYKRVFTHDLNLMAFLSPGRMVLRHTPIEIKVVVMNIGQETEHDVLWVDIFDDAGEQVYHKLVGLLDILPGEKITMIADSCWTPGEIGEVYTVRAHTGSVRDECRNNDTLFKTVVVGCDDTLGYDWNFGDVWSWGINSGDYHFMTSYAVDNGVLVKGGRTWISSVYGTGYPAIELYEANSGCGATGPSNEVAQGTCETFQVGWNEAWFGGFGVFVKSGSPGNIWAACTPASTPSGYYGELGQHTWSAPGSCYSGSGPGRGAYLDPDFHWGGYSGDFYTPANELYVHLGFGSYPLSPRPSAPCYDGGIHDVTVFRMEDCYFRYIEAGSALTPEIAIANIGRQAESDTFPVKFLVVDTVTLDTVFVESTMVGHIGWMGEQTDDPDTLFVPITPWTPEGRCDETYPFVDYELIHLVNLGAVGPDSSDHCPYNDTVRREATCLWSHDVGVTDLTWPEEPPYGPGSTITVTATVENFGYDDEQDIPVRLEISDAETGELLWHALENISFLDWRGNVPGNPYQIDVTFPAYSVLSEDTFRITCRTELEGDLCAADDGKTRRPGIEESNTSPSCFALEVAGGVVTDACQVSFAVPHTTVVNLGIYDAGGRLVKTLNNEVCLPGYHTKTWNGLDNSGRKAAAGIYLIRMQAEGFDAVKKVIILN